MNVSIVRDCVDYYFLILQIIIIFIAVFQLIINNYLENKKNKRLFNVYLNYLYNRLVNALENKDDMQHQAAINSWESNNNIYILLLDEKTYMLLSGICKIFYLISTKKHIKLSHIIKEHKTNKDYEEIYKRLINAIMLLETKYNCKKINYKL